MPDMQLQTAASRAKLCNLMQAIATALMSIEALGALRSLRARASCPWGSKDAESRTQSYLQGFLVLRVAEVVARGSFWHLGFVWGPHV